MGRERGAGGSRDHSVDGKHNVSVSYHSGVGFEKEEAQQFHVVSQ